MLPSEIIKSCLDYKLLKVTSDGTVYSIRAGRFLGCLSSKGYYVCSLHYRGQKAQVKIHQIIWIYFKGLIPRGKIIDHIDRNKLNNCIDNLRLVSQLENSHNRRSYVGSNNPSSKIDVNIASEIRSLYKELKSYSKLAKMFGISKSLIASIIRRESWN